MEKKSKSITGLPISALERSILIDIISRLPLKTIFNCLCVCKSWHELIFHADFAKLRLTRTADCLVLRSRKHGGRRRPRNLCLINLDASDICSQEALMKLSPCFNLPTDNFEVVSSCNGLICVGDFRSENRLFYILNPLLGEYITVPMPRKKGNFGVLTWFGHSPRTDQYKVVRFAHQSVVSHLSFLVTYIREIEVYTLGWGGSWRSVEFAARSIDLRPCYAFLEGCIHWVDQDRDSFEFICCFDVGSEKLKSLPAPSCFDSNVKVYWNGDMMVGTLGGCLYLFDCPQSDHFDIWVMKKYGVQDSWTKDFVIKNPNTEVLWYWDFYRPISLLKNGEILILHKSNSLACYNPKNGLFKLLKIYKMQNFEATAYSPSFVSVKDIVLGKKFEGSDKSQIEAKNMSLMWAGD